MDDRELLELAAKAAGIELEWYGKGFACIRDAYFKDSTTDWNPLEYDGDALRLAVRMTQMYSFYRFMRSWIIAMTTAQGDLGEPCSATRRAIVRAAAEIGRALKTQA